MLTLMAAELKFSYQGEKHKKKKENKVLEIWPKYILIVRLSSPPPLQSVFLSILVVNQKLWIILQIRRLNIFYNIHIKT